MKTIKQKKIQVLPKSPTGIVGLDELLSGGLPENRATLICGNAGCGKTLFSMEYLIHGVSKFNQPGLFISFEETDKELIQNFSSFDFSIKRLIKKNKLIIEHIKIDKSDFHESGSYNLAGLFIRIENIIKKYNIKRVALDSMIEVLFNNLNNTSMLRSEMWRLFQWFKSKKVTVLVTAEQGKNALTRYNIEEYIADCVIFLDSRVNEQVSTRRLRVVKYRGSPHETHEVPFLMTRRGISVSSISSLKLDYPASHKVISSGIPQLDDMLGKNGFYLGSTVLVTGPAGIGKTSIAITFAKATIERHEKCIFFSFEESPDQLARNMESIGINLKLHMQKGLLKLICINPTTGGYESHLLNIESITNEFNPQVVIIDAISTLRAIGTNLDVKFMLYQLVTYFKNKNITFMMTSLTSVIPTRLIDDENISSLIDKWIHTIYLEDQDEHTRYLLIRKARGMSHSKQVRELLISNTGIRLVDIYKDIKEKIAQYTRKEMTTK